MLYFNSADFGEYVEHVLSDYGLTNPYTTVFDNRVVCDDSIYTVFYVAVKNETIIGFTDTGVDGAALRDYIESAAVMRGENRNIEHAYDENTRIGYIATIETFELNGASVPVIELYYRIG